MKKRTLLTAVLLGAVLGSPAAAAQQPSGESAKPAAAQPAPAQNAHDPVNVRLELTITIADAKGIPIVAKSASLHVVDRDSGRIRMHNSHNSEGPNLASMLNVDATPSLVARERIRVNLSFEYTPVRQEGQALSLGMNQRLSAVVESGKSVLISQTTEPGTDRQVRVELKATILK